MFFKKIKRTMTNILKTYIGGSRDGETTTSNDAWQYFPVTVKLEDKGRLVDGKYTPNYWNEVYELSGDRYYHKGWK